MPRRAPDVDNRSFEGLRRVGDREPDAPKRGSGRAVVRAEDDARLQDRPPETRGIDAIAVAVGKGSGVVIASRREDDRLRAPVTQRSDQLPGAREPQGAPGNGIGGRSDRPGRPKRRQLGALHALRAHRRLVTDRRAGAGAAGLTRREQGSEDQAQDDSERRRTLSIDDH